MKIFQFFSANLLEIDQAQFKNSNYDVLLSTWLVSIEICHRGIFVFFWYLLVQIKVHKEHIRTKRETLMRIQNLAKYLRWSFLRKCLQHQPPEVFCKKVFLEISQDSQENTCAGASFLIKLQARPATLLEKKLWHRCFPGNFEKFLRTPFLQNTSCFCTSVLSGFF